ncbi:MAG: pteridine reductase [Legionella sp.]|nr:pteridine reductase [Legionella sp.]
MKPTNKQDVKVALVTGGARRIGAGIVKQLHQAGFKVVIHCNHSLKEAHELAVDLNKHRIDSAFVLQRELCDGAAASEMIQTIEDWAGRLDVLVNNASIFTRDDVIYADFSTWDILFNTNVKVPYLLSQAARNLLSAQGGVIINITDIHAFKPLKGYSAYCQSKAALDMQTKAFACEFAPHIRVNAIAPGAIIWPENDNQLSTLEQEKIINQTALKCHGDPKFIAQTLLAMVENPFITGQTIKVDGGRSLF